MNPTGKTAPAAVCKGGRDALRVMVLVKAGVMMAGEGPHPSSRGNHVRLDGPSRTVADGPFAATGESGAGFWIWQVRDMDDAIAWAKRCPNPMPRPSEVEIRPLLELADFNAAVTPGIAEQEERLRGAVGKG